MPRLLVIDDQDHTVEMCHRHLPELDWVTRCDRPMPCQVCEERDRGCPLKCAHDWAEARELLTRLPALPDLVVLDLHFALPEERLLPEDKGELPAAPRARAQALEALRRTQGLHILERLRAEWPTLPVVLLTATGADLPELVDPLVYLCANEVVDSRTLAGGIWRALELHHTAQEGPIFWGKSRAMADLRRALATLSRSPLPVLLEGETGTGKSWLAEHFLHPRSGAKGPLVVTDLSTVPAALLPAHLFGARRGAYTGAIEDSAGVFEQADGGTLFLDEIANLDLDAQRQLLLVLERGVVTRLGDVRPRPVRVKVVAATNQDVARLVAEGRFRADLHMRLSPATRLRVPALRERREDLPDLVRFALLEALSSEALLPLVRSFLARFPTPDDFRPDASAVVFGRPSARTARTDAFTVFLGKWALDRLCAHPWPGNQRELRMLTTHVLTLLLLEQLEAEVPARTARAPAVLAIPDALVARLLGEAEAPRTQPVRAGPGSTVEVRVQAGQSFSRVAADVERQVLEALYERTAGDLDRMGELLLGQRGAARRVHVRMNQLGLSLRALRGRRAREP